MAKETMNIPLYLHLVSEFHRAFQYRQPEPIAPDFDDASTNELRPRLIAEEIHELREAIDASDRVETLDALCDIQYVLSGAVLAWGLRAHVENTKPVTDSRTIRDMDGHLAAMLRLNGQIEIAAKCGRPHQVYTFLQLLQIRLAKTVLHFGFDRFTDAFREVHRSNMSKLWDKPDYQAEGVYQMDATIGGKWIARRGDGKILKPASYSPAKLEAFV